MIDLRIKGLPKTVLVDGEPFLVVTDFRKWLTFDQLLQKPEIKLFDLWEYIAQDKKPMDPDATLKALVDFYFTPSATPNNIGNDSSVKLVDFVKDGEYIYASFMQAYGINLVEVDMHWHEFKALFNGLPDDCKIAKIMAYRAYKKSNKSAEKIYEEQRDMWAFREEKSPEDAQIMEDIRQLFYNAN